MQHEQGSGRERAQAMASEERELSDLFRRAEKDYEARLASQVTTLNVALHALNQRGDRSLVQFA